MLSATLATSSIRTAPASDCCVLLTPRLQLREWQANDLDAFLGLHADPEVKAAFGGQCLTVNDARSTLSGYAVHWRHHRLGMWAICLRAANLPIGQCGVFMVGDGVAELIFLLARSHRQLGLASEAVAACLAHAFAESPLDRVIAITYPDNNAAQNVLRTLGMRREWLSCYDPLDAICYSIIRGTSAVSHKLHAHAV